MYSAGLCVIRPERVGTSVGVSLWLVRLSLLESCKDVAVLFKEKSLSHSDYHPHSVLLPLCTELTLV